ncbi:MAG: DUF1513 domain-containing protein [Hyphomicrobiales bacterium]|nr:DUF1513 domain-containing protein [Hyphomicrobiales bacterium]
MNRRQFVRQGLALAAGAGFAAAAGPALGAGAPRATAPGAAAAALLVPGYRPYRARVGGRPIDQDPAFRRNLPRGYDGATTLVTRLDPDGRVRRALMPVRGHQIVPHPGGGPAFFNSIEGDGFCTFDPATLALDRVLTPHRPGFVGGGHAAYSADGRHLFVLERRTPGAYSGTPADHFGVVAVRDAATLAVVDAFSCHGIGPHDIALTDGGRTLAVANYGSTDWGDSEDGTPPNVIEPSVTLLDAASGALRRKVAGRAGRYEIRHLACPPAGPLVAIQTRLVPDAQERAEVPAGTVYEADDTVDPRLSFTPAPLLAVPAGGGPPAEVACPDGARFRQGQSIVYEPEHDEVIVTFASGHALAVLDAATAALRRVVRTDRLGLYYPRGLALLPGGRYAVSGSWRGLYVFDRGSHAPRPDETRHVTFFEHSHLTPV